MTTKKKAIIYTCLLLLCSLLSAAIALLFLPDGAGKGKVEELSQAGEAGARIDSPEAQSRQNPIICSPLNPWDTSFPL